jgi:hypothetical protein
MQWRSALHLDHKHCKSHLLKLVSFICDGFVLDGLMVVEQAVTYRRCDFAKLSRRVLGILSEAQRQMSPKVSNTACDKGSALDRLWKNVCLRAAMFLH